MQSIPTDVNGCRSGAASTKKRQRPKEKTASAPDAAAVEALLKKIKEEQAKLNTHETDAVASVIRIARHLTELRPLAKKTWTTNVKSLGMDPRVARRYLRLGRSWLGQNGLSESVLLAHLPSNIMKVEWICRLTREQLSELLATMDTRTESRNKVIAAVRAALGQEPRKKAKPDIAAVVEKLVKHLVESIHRLREECSRADDKGRAGGLLAAGLEQVRGVLQQEVAPANESRAAG
jgi:hypothetical protein